MPICIECRYPVPQLYHTSTSSKSGGSGGGASTQTGGAVNSSGASSFVASALAQAPGTNSSTSGSAPEEAPRAAPAPAKRSRGGGGGEAARKGPAGGDVRLTQCPRCRRFADKYVEHDFVVLFIDLVLVKPQVYRHLLFNRLGSDDDRFDPAITRLGTLLLLFDVYLTWSHIESLPTSLTGSSAIPRLPILAQYTFYLVLCSGATLAQHLTIRLLARTFASPTHTPPHANAPSASGSRWGTPLPGAHSGATTPTPTPGIGGANGGWSPVASFHSGSGGGSGANASTVSNTTPTLSNTHTHTPQTTQPTPQQGWASSSLSGPSGTTGPTTHVRTPGPNAVSTALFVSSCMQLFPILMVVWKYDDQGGQLARGVSWAVGAQNVEALRILLGKTYPMAAGLVAAGALARYAAKRLVLGLVGLGFAA